MKSASRCSTTTPSPSPFRARIFRRTGSARSSPRKSATRCRIGKSPRISSIPRAHAGRAHRQTHARPAHRRAGAGHRRRKLAHRPQPERRIEAGAAENRFRQQRLARIENAAHVHPHVFRTARRRPRGRRREAAFVSEHHHRRGRAAHAAHQQRPRFLAHGTRREEIQFPAVRLVEVVRGIETFRPHLEAGGFKFDCELPDAPVSVRGDAPTRLSQIIVNLLSNAEKYSNGGKEITLQLAQSNRRCRTPKSRCWIAAPACRAAARRKFSRNFTARTIR
jgi:hypothetical protein